MLRTSSRKSCHRRCKQDSVKEKLELESLHTEQNTEAFAAGVYILTGTHSKQKVEEL